MTKLTKEQIYNLIKTKQDEKKNTIVADTDYYLKVFTTHQGKGVFKKWNWACFFAALFRLEFLWFVHRKMYLRGFFAFLISQALLWVSLLSYEFFGLSTHESYQLTGLINPFTILWSIALGFYGNYIYWDFICKKYKKGVKTIGYFGDFPYFYILFEIVIIIILFLASRYLSPTP